MDQREYSDNNEEAIRTALDARQAKIQTAIPGIIQSFDPTKQTAVVQPAIQAKQLAQDGTVSLINYPLCLDCPVHFPKGGGVTFTFPVAEGDECQLVFSSRSIDGWWQNSGIQAPVEARMHDLSDAHAYVGFSSVPNVISDISTTDAQIRSDDGSTLIGLNPTSQVVTITAPGGLVVNADMTVHGSITADDDVVGNSISLDSHTHSGVTTGSGDTGEPVS